MDSTRLEILTEFVESPVPVIARRKMKDGDDDQRLRFGSMSMGPGIAFLTGAEGGQTNSVIQGQAPSDSLPVSKQWMKMEGRTFLIESLKYDSIEPRVENLPKPEAKASSGNERVAKVKASEKRQLPVIREARAGVSEKLRMASEDSSPSGFLIDYEIVSGSTDYTFKGDTTYYVSGGVNIYGTITLEGGAVIKFAPTNNAQINSMNGLFDCKTDAYRPAVFTARDDDSVGENIGSTNVPAYYNACFAFKGGTSVLSNVRFSYASWPCSFWSGSSGGEIQNAQFVHCAIPINTEGKTVRLRNVLITDSMVPLRGNGAYTISAENVTVDDADTQLGGPGGGTILFTNSIIVAFTNLGPATVITNNSLIDAYPVAGLFQTVEAGSYYLATNSLYRDIGTTNINSGLLTNLWSRTTYPPIVYSNVTFYADTTLSPQAQRDVDIPDLGYHYDPIDYAASSLTVSSNASLILTNGVRLGIFGTSGITVSDGAHFVSEGRPELRNKIFYDNAVQENSANSASPNGIFTVDSSTTSEFRMRFSDVAFLSAFSTKRQIINGDSGFINLRDCELFNVYFVLESGTAGANPTAYCKNCLFERCQTSIASIEDTKGDEGETLAIYLEMYNNLFWNGSIVFLQDVAIGSYDWKVINSVFDGTAVSAFTFPMENHHNGYVNSTSLPSSWGNDKTMTNFVYDTGPLGHYYQNSTNLIDAGSTTADNLGLYHYTTRTNEVKETNSIVDIGYHYVAVNTNGIPFDADDDGDPDYHEDTNGDGTIDSGETNPSDGNDLGLRVLITQPKEGSLIP